MLQPERRDQLYLTDGSVPTPLSERLASREVPRPLSK
jgi:hypothetical protein